MPAAACWTLSATTSATWISSGSILPGEHENTDTNMLDAHMQYEPKDDSWVN